MKNMKKQVKESLNDEKADEVRKHLAEIGKLINSLPTPLHRRALICTIIHVLLESLPNEARTEIVETVLKKLSDDDKRK